jgi:hypothetical protein
VLFRKRDKHAGVPARGHQGAGTPQDHAGLHRIDFDMMLKGNVVLRKGKPIRQLGVTVDGSTRLVTSGDLVDQETYQALLAVGAIRVAGQEAPPLRLTRPVSKDFPASDNPAEE